MIKAIPMEDWLRGCIYHDGRHGYVTLPTDRVHQIANYIQRTRRSGTDGLIDLEVVEADRKTEPQPCEWCKFYDGENCFSQEPCKVMLYLKTEPTSSKMEQVDKDINVRSKTEPQTCANGCKWLDQDGECTEPSGECHLVYRTIEDEPQTERSE